MKETRENMAFEGPNPLIPPKPSPSTELETTALHRRRPVWLEPLALDQPVGGLPFVSVLAAYIVATSAPP